MVASTDSLLVFCRLAAAAFSAAMRQPHFNFSLKL
jgi:hypothetical protein